MIPCHSCILIPICRHKKYHELCFDCPILFDGLYNVRVLDMTHRADGFHEQIKEVVTTLKPTRWKLNYFVDTNVITIRGIGDDDSL